MKKLIILLILLATSSVQAAQSITCSVQQRILDQKAEGLAEATVGRVENKPVKTDIQSFVNQDGKTIKILMSADDYYGADIKIISGDNKNAPSETAYLDASISTQTPSTFRIKELNLHIFCLPNM